MASFEFKSLTVKFNVENTYSYFFVQIRASSHGGEAHQTGHSVKINDILLGWDITLAG